jgi:RNA polymerase sigma factor (TIGR02999 family)
LSERPGPERSLDELSAELYANLKGIALSIVQGQRGVRLVEPTELVHEAYLNLAGMQSFAEMRRPDFLALAATVIRNLLVDLARRQQRAKRGGGWQRVTLRDVDEVGDGDPLDVLALDEALTRLGKEDERLTRIVELRFFGGLTRDEIATLLEIPSRTVGREWALARAWLRRELSRN